MRTTIIRSLLLAAAILAVSAASSAQISISVNFGPPALPVYQQPPCPGDGYIWTPGYWAWDPVAGYYWVPGTWVLPPEPGLLWTPGYWAFDNGLYYWNAGYWGPTVGYYGGIDYGFGYNGAGYYGGYWRDNHFFYNRAVTNVNVTRIHDVYRTAAPPSPAASRVSFNGGPDGTRVRPTAQQETFARERHVAPTAVQTQHERAAGQNQQLFASTNRGRPAVAATAKPGAFKGNGVVAASRAGAPYHPPAKPATAKTRNAPAPAARPENNAARPNAERGRTPAPPAETTRPNAREAAPPNERPAQPERQTRPQNAPRSQAAPPPSASKREVAPPAERPAQPERQARPENQSRAQAAPPPKREAAPAPERAPQARPEKAPPAPKAEARPAEPKAPPREEKEPPKQEPPR